MNNFPMNLNLPSQPAPNVVGATGNASVEVAEKKPQRVFNIPKVGVVDVPVISKTPLPDTIEIKKQDNPKMAYKLAPKSNKGFNMQNASSIGIFACSILALISLLAKKKGK